MKITKQLCENAVRVLTAEGTRRKDGWVGFLNEITNEQPQQEAVASLVHTILSNTQAFACIATRMLPQYMVDHPEIKSQDLAFHSLMTQLAVRMMVYISKYVEEAAELQEMFDMNFDKKDSK